MKKKRLLKELELFAEKLGFSVRYEKGTFAGGDCRVYEDKILVVNKFLPLEARIATIAKVVTKHPLPDEEKAFQKLKKAAEQYL